MTDLKGLIDAGRLADAFATLLEEARGRRSYAELRRLVQARQRLATAGFQPTEELTPLRVAVAGDATTAYLTPILSLLLECRGVAPDMHEVPYASVEAELLRTNTALGEFRPQLVALLQTPLAISDWPPDTAGEAEAINFAEGRAGTSLALCRVAHERLGCEVVLDNWHLLPERPHGSWARRMPAERNAIIRRMNAILDRDATPTVHLHDVDTLASSYGLERWLDRRLWYHAKQPISFASVGGYLSSLSATIAAPYRANVKCVVLDLDNTLWGGVVGDDGLAGIKIRQGDAEGEAFQAFQRHILRLKQRGVLLAVCSKNEHTAACAPFRELPDMVLTLDDFVAFKANWDPKPQNLVAIAEELNLGLDALAFVDDNPVERAHVRAALPMVRVVDMPEDPADYPAALDQSGWFEVGGLSAEDLLRTEQYRANASRAAVATSMEDYAGYLASLQQRARIGPFEVAQLDRIAQLVNKTNQFNLTTRRTTRSELLQLMGRADGFTATVRLTDRFGDNGLIAVMNGSIVGSVLHIDQWLMSCRVFNRGVEQMLMNYVVSLAQERGLREIIGVYRPTAKNPVVRDLYPRLGFASTPAPNAADDATVWTLSVATHQPLPHVITLDDEELT